VSATAPDETSLPSSLVSHHGELYYLPAFIPARETGALFERLMTELDWQQEVITIAGRRVTVPRLVCWHGEPGAVYRYSGVDHEPVAWTETLRLLKQRVQQACHHIFNSVLGNLYRNGQDSMGWHADKEKALGRDPVIASLSFGAMRLFRIRHDKTGETLDLRLGDGSLLLMRGSLQHHWRHCVPKSPAVCGARINLTFRTIVAIP
jgi:alkylated DNA repair dioxygenase AlkB